MGTRGAEKRNPRHPGDQREVVQKREPGIKLSPEPHAQETAKARDPDRRDPEWGPGKPARRWLRLRCARGCHAVCSHLGGPPAKTEHVNDK